MLKRTWSALILAFSLAAIPLLEAATLPRKAPEFAVTLPDGKQVLLSSLKGKGVALAFILTTCSHCQAYTRLLSKVQTDFGSKGLQVIECALDDNAKALVPGFIRAYQPPFPVGYCGNTPARDFLEKPTADILHMPAVAFIDKDGLIVAQFEAGGPFIEMTPEENLRKGVEALLSGAATAKKAPPPAKTPANKTPAAPKKK